MAGPNPQDPAGVRQHERFSCRLAATFTVDPEHAEQVRPARAESGETSPPVEVVDCGRGGLGLRGKRYLPKNTRITVRTNLDGQPVDVSLRVMRALMADRAPTYYLGCALVGAAAAGEVTKIIEHVKRQAA